MRRYNFIKIPDLAGCTERRQQATLTRELRSKVGAVRQNQNTFHRNLSRFKEFKTSKSGVDLAREGNWPMNYVSPCTASSINKQSLLLVSSPVGRKPRRI